MIQNRIINKSVLGVEVSLPRIIRRGNLPDLTGRCFTEIYRQGKFICFNLDNNLKMYAHLRMTGTFLWDRDIAEKPSHIRAEIRFKDGCLLYRDIRTLGGIWLSNDGWVPWKKLGLDPLSDEFTTEALEKDLANRRISIKQALLDQSIVAGIGNIYASEVLFTAGVNPLHAANSLSTNDIANLREAVKTILIAAIDAGGTTFRDFKLSDGRDGEFQNFLKVYGKDEKPCEKCHTLIRRIVQGQRSTYYCPKCQPIK